MDLCIVDAKLIMSKTAGSLAWVKVLVQTILGANAFLIWTYRKQNKKENSKIRERQMEKAFLFTKIMFDES